MKLHTSKSETKESTERKNNSRILAYLNLWDVQGQIKGKNYFHGPQLIFCKLKRLISLADYKLQFN